MSTGEKRDYIDSRARKRGAVSILADVRTPGGIRAKVYVIDLSETGFRMECLAYIPSDRVIFLTIPGFAQLEARIAWRWSEWICGCQFVQPLYPAVYDHILKAHPALARPL